MFLCFLFLVVLKKNIVCISVNIKYSEDMAGLNWENIQQVEEILLSPLDILSPEPVSLTSNPLMGL